MSSNADCPKSTAQSDRPKSKAQSDRPKSKTQSDRPKLTPKSKRPNLAKQNPTDAILPMHERFMDEIVAGGKNYEFRHYRIRPSVQRIWFYCTAPSSAIKYICEIDPPRTRNPGDPPLDLDGRGNLEFNTRAKGWEKDEFAYRIRSIYQVEPPVTLADMKSTYGMKIAPQGLVFVPAPMAAAIEWDKQKMLKSRSPDPTPILKESTKRKREGLENVFRPNQRTKLAAVSSLK